MATNNIVNNMLISAPKHVPGGTTSSNLGIVYLRHIFGLSRDVMIPGIELSYATGTDESVSNLSA